MRGLLDVNVLIALLDRDHSLHGRARAWFSEHARSGWASCPMTQNGCVRVMAHPSYPGVVSVGAILERLAEAVATHHHEFWPDDISLLDPGVAHRDRVHGPRQVTDLYLLALAVRHGGRFVSFDGSIPTTAVRGAEKKHLLTL